MADFKESFPEGKPFKCCAAWHLRTSGNLQAIYNFLGALTNGGKNPFYSSMRKVAIFFYGREDDSTYETVRGAFNTLRKMGLLRKDENGHWWYISHDSWAAANPGKCQKRELFPWQESVADPLVSAIWAASRGKMRLNAGLLKTIRKVATDERFIEEFKLELKTADDRRVPGGNWEGTSPRACFWRAYQTLKAAAAFVEQDSVAEEMAKWEKS